MSSKKKSKNIKIWKTQQRPGDIRPELDDTILPGTQCLAGHNKRQAPARLPIAHRLAAPGHRRAVHTRFQHYFDSSRLAVRDFCQAPVSLMWQVDPFSSDLERENSS